jgi:hypothetical protein
MAMGELIDVAGRATIDTALTLSPRELAGPKRRARVADGARGWHGKQNGAVSLAERKARLRRRGEHQGKSLEVEIPA